MKKLIKNEVHTECSFGPRSPLNNIPEYINMTNSSDISQFILD